MKMKCNCYIYLYSTFIEIQAFVFDDISELQMHNHNIGTQTFEMYYKKYQWESQSAVVLDFLIGKQILKSNSCTLFSSNRMKVSYCIYR